MLKCILFMGFVMGTLWPLRKSIVIGVRNVIFLVLRCSPAFNNISQKPTVERKKKEEGKRHPIGAEEYILHTVKENAETSMRQLASESSVSQWKVCDILKENKFHPYYFMTVQALEYGDYEARQNFC